MELTTLIVAAIFLIIWLWFRRTDPHLPPSPMRPLPIVGHLLYIASDTRTQFKEWRERCGDIYSLYMGSSLMVVLNGYDLIKEALVKKGDVFSDRPPYFMDLATGTFQKGIAFSNGEHWKEQRSVSVSILRAFGMGKNSLAEKIQEEVGCYVKHLSSLKGKSTDIHLFINISVSNIICSILIGERFDYDDKNFQDLMHKILEIYAVQQNVGLVNFMFWLRHLPGDIFKAKKSISDIQGVINTLKKFVEKKRRHLDNFKDMNNMIDAYILERNRKVQSGISTTLEEETLTKIMFEFFLAATDTTTSTIYWCILYMLHNPEVQEKVYNEIKDKVGTDRTPTIQDKTQLTYLNAVITETQRLASIVPFSVTHACSEEVTLRGYTLPKGTYILPNLDSVLHDKTTWGEDAMSFRPERFIDDDGKLNIPEQFIPFGTGRRMCLGEALAKMELFLFLSSMFQKFQFLPPAPDSIPGLSYECSFVISATAYQVRVVERN